MTLRSRSKKRRVSASTVGFIGKVGSIFGSWGFVGVPDFSVSSSMVRSSPIVEYGDDLKSDDEIAILLKGSFQDLIVDSTRFCSKDSLCSRDIISDKREDTLGDFIDVLTSG